ncbi:uncharacterized protein B0H18DRAFT_1081093 [Fomitopsis serialis]|uniref:uncharacterized protein n=1 Tax=Fomitopsis serialis TaxID=139415 RepID=UPI00200832AC|nr:uncharacterized protein B0H18DRAFT_1081093 [Neoantrodia serialis]KAH9938416.1 hypothetical protein B0H18DRAFT_1081093 [Neoantrodia serialis]
MSSISFPSNNSSFISGASSFEHDEHSHTPSFDNVSDAFHMNPLSAHPPRTPRPSTGMGSSVYGTEVYHKLDETPETKTTYEEDSEDEDDKARAEAEGKVRKEEIWRDLFTTSNGRDKALKIMQYSLRLYLVFHSGVTATSLLKNRKSSSWEADILKRFESTANGFSLTRRCLILFNWLVPLTSIMEQHNNAAVSGGDSSRKGKSKPLLHTLLNSPPPVLLDLLCGAADDVYTFHRLGMLGPKLGERAGRVADWCWFAGTLVNLVENTVERSVLLNLQHEVESRLYKESMSGQTAKSNPTANRIDDKELSRLQKQDFWIQVTRFKLLMDLIFVSYNVFRLNRAKRPVQTITGLTAAFLSTAKLYDRHKTVLIKAAKH